MTNAECMFVCIPKIVFHIFPFFQWVVARIEVVQFIQPDGWLVALMLANIDRAGFRLPLHRLADRFANGAHRKIGRPIVNKSLDRVSVSVSGVKPCVINVNVHTGIDCDLPFLQFSCREYAAGKKYCAQQQTQRHAKEALEFDVHISSPFPPESGNHDTGEINSRLKYRLPFMISSLIFSS